MSKKGILIIGAGGVSRVATVKCAMNIDTFEKITLASRTVSKCESMAADILKNQGVQIDVASVDADNVDELVKLIEKVNPKEVLVNGKEIPVSENSRQELLQKLNLF